MKFEELFPGINLENESVEFKGILNDKVNEDDSLLLSWLKTINAYANSSGGVLFVGVEDKTHKVLSLNNLEADKQILLIHRELAQRFEPSIDYQINPLTIKGNETRYILQINIKASSIKPVFLHSKGSALVFVRDVGITRLATSEEIRNMVLFSENISYDSIFTHQNYKSEDFSSLQNAAVKNTGKNLSDKQLMSIGFMNSNYNLSKGALLFKDDCKSNECRVDITFYPSINKGQRIIYAPKSFIGPIVNVIDEATVYINEHSLEVWLKNDQGRENLPSYPIRSIKEGISNALCHRNYYLTTSIIEIDVYIDRLEIISPGSLLGVSRIKKETQISSITPRRRNEVIARTLEAINYVENKGSGFDLIAEDYYNVDENHKPYISCDQNHFVLTMPNLNYKKGVINEENANPEVYVDDVTIDERDLDILSFCYVNKKRASEIAKSLNVASSTYFRKNILGKLVDKKYLLLDSSEKIPTYLSNRTFVKLTKI